MGKYIFTYNAEDPDYTSQEIREEVIKFLHGNGATNIKQCLDTTFIFQSQGTTEQWFRLIQTSLDGKGHVLESCHYLLNKVFYTEAAGYELKAKCNRDLQDFVDTTIADL